MENDKIRNKIKLQVASPVVYDPKLCAVVIMPLLSALNHDMLEVQGVHHKSLLVQLGRNALSSVALET